MNDFDYFKCRECGFDSIQRSDFSGSECCPLCAEDNGRDVVMQRRTAVAEDKPEGFDARKGTRAAQQLPILQEISDD